MKVLFAVICSLTLLCGISRGEQVSCKQQSQYENHNMVDYGPLEFSSVIDGSAIDPSGAAVNGACIFVFTEKGHHLITTTQADDEGKFNLTLKHGTYRIVVKMSPLCAANIPVHVVQKASTNLLVHLKPRGIDECSYGEAK
jgi:carboxypeptidase family protein